MITTILSALAAALAYFGLRLAAVDSCKLLAETYPNSTHLPHHPSYLALNIYWANNTFHRPHCIFTPPTSSSAAYGLHALAKHNTPFAIRSGGHSMNPGFSSTSSGVLVSLKHLDQISHDIPAGTVTIGAGNTWGRVYRHLSPFGLTVAGGRGSSVGVGGYSLGGGFSFFLHERGLSCDEIVAYTVATAKGEVLTVTEDGEHGELWRSLKGSGAPFVVVLSFTYKLIKLEDASGIVWGGSITSSEASVTLVLNSVAEFAAGEGVQDTKTHVLTVVIHMLDAAQTSITTMITNYVFYPSPLSSTPVALHPLVDAHNTHLLHSTVGNRSIESITDEIVAQGSGYRQFMVQWTVLNPTPEVVQEMEKITKEVAEIVFTVPEFVIVLTLVPIGLSAVSAGKRNILGLEEGRRYLSVSWNLMLGKEEDDEVVYSAIRSGKQKAEVYLKSNNHWAEWTYMNYAWAEQDPIGSYGGENMELLRRVAGGYDPDGVWEKLVKGGFKVPKA
ncbi:hypothetical protein BDD12DRAFT_869315 [Trichophaea hybrida]|nr:hypothetical protein BDD12DRAFT_869315 [Trichophaea hybrida]